MTVYNTSVYRHGSRSWQWSVNLTSCDMFENHEKNRRERNRNRERGQSNISKIDDEFYK